MVALLNLVALCCCVGLMHAAQDKIDHIVMVMLENRSFDHLLGFLRADNKQIDGLTGTESNPFNASDPASKRAVVTHDAPDADPDAGHSVEDTTEQVFGTVDQPRVLPSVAPMDGFVQNAERLHSGWGPQVMACFNKSTLPVISTLASEFAIFDEYFASIPGPTEVNRLYVHSSTSHGDAYNNIDKLIDGYPQKSIYEKLHENNRTFGSFYHEVPTTLFFDFMRHPANLNEFHNFSDFAEFAANGTLPDYSFIDPRYFDVGPIRAEDQHPSHSMYEGELFLKRIYEAVRLSPKWSRTLLIITYDEHGGFYDHYPTPLHVPNPDGLVSTKPAFNFTRIGVRVPFILASPWIEKGTVVHGAQGPEADSQYEHSSVPGTISKLFGLAGGPLTKREAWAGTFEKVLSRSSPRLDCPLVLPEPPRPAFMVDGTDPISPLQQGFIDLAHALLVSRDGEAAMPRPGPAATEEQGGCYVMRAVAKYLNKPVDSVCEGI